MPIGIYSSSSSRDCLLTFLPWRFQKYNILRQDLDPATNCLNVHTSISTIPHSIASSSRLRALHSTVVLGTASRCVQPETLVVLSSASYNVLLGRQVAHEVKKASLHVFHIPLPQPLFVTFRSTTCLRIVFSGLGPGRRVRQHPSHKSRTPASKRSPTIEAHFGRGHQGCRRAAMHRRWRAGETSILTMLLRVSKAFNYDKEHANLHFLLACSQLSFEILILPVKLCSGASKPATRRKLCLFHRLTRPNIDTTRMQAPTPAAPVSELKRRREKEGEVVRKLWQHHVGKFQH